MATDISFDKTLPTNLEAEQLILGAMIMDSSLQFRLMCLKVIFIMNQIEKYFQL